MLDQNEESIKDFDKAIEIDPQSAWNYCSRGNAKARLRQYEEAIKDFNKAIELDFNYVHAYCNRGYVNLQLKQYKKARKDLFKTKELAEEQKDTKLLKINAKSLQELDEAEKQTKK